MVSVSDVLVTRPGRWQWWNLCFVYGDQTKYYRQLYGKRRQIKRIEVKCQACGNQLDTIENR